MSEILKDVSAIWTRLFDHKAFLHGEIQFTLREFEQKRSDTELEKLISSLEYATIIKSSQADPIKQFIQTKLPQANADLSQALSLCNQINDVALKYEEDSTLELAREDRRAEWGKFVDDIAQRCTQLDTTFEEKEKEFQEFYKDLEEKLHINK